MPRLQLSLPLLVVTATALLSNLRVGAEFDCGEEKGVDDSFMCDGDEDCFLGLDESDDVCANLTLISGSRSREQWLTKFLDHEYLQVGGCGQPDILPKFRYRERRLVGGEQALRGSWPWQTALYKRDQELVYCAGTLIHRQWVLTAAHCVESLEGDVQNLELWFGKHDVTMQEVASQKRRAARLFKHRNHRYPNHKSNDIALVKLREPVTIAPYVQLACLPTKIEFKAKDSCYLAGWGRVSEPGDDVIYPANLFQLRFPMVQHQLCNSEPAWNRRITNKQICAGGDGEHDMCWGDSGGGLVCSHIGRYLLQGISSFTGHLCAVDNRPAIFTKVDRYLGWISDIIKGAHRHGPQ